LITNLGLLLNTALIAIASSVVSVLIGLPFGNWLSRLSPGIQRVVAAVVVVPFLLPPLLVGIALRPLLGDLNIDSNIGILVIIAAHALMNFGFVGRVVASSSIGRSQFEAGMLDGANNRQLRRHLQTPQQLLALSSVGLLIALYSATSYGLILVLGGGVVRTLETEIAKAALQRLDLETAGTLAVLQSLLTLGLYFFAKRFGRYPAALDQVGKGAIPASPFQRLLGPVLVVLTASALAGVLVRAVSGKAWFTHFENLISQQTQSLLNITIVQAASNSVRNMLVVMLIVIPIAMLFAGRNRGASWVLLPLGVSPVVLGLSVLVFSGYLPREISGSWLLVPVIQALFALPLAYQILRPARLAFDQQLRDAAYLDGAGSLKSLLLIELPLIRKPLAIALAFTALSSLGEFGVASFLAYGSQQTLPLVLFSLIGRPGESNFGMAMAISSIYILLTAFIVWLATVPDRSSLRTDQVA
jgi:thiamine transport system permease protein